MSAGPGNCFSCFGRRGRDSSRPAPHAEARRDFLAVDDGARRAPALLGEAHELLEANQVQGKIEAARDAGGAAGPLVVARVEALIARAFGPLRFARVRPVLPPPNDGVAVRTCGTPVSPPWLRRGSVRAPRSWRSAEVPMVMVSARCAFELSRSSLRRYIMWPLS